jgi:hypothetical protein
MKYLYILLICLILFYLISRYFEKYYSQENFDPSLVPVSSIITLAKVAQKIVDGNGTLTNPANLNIGTTTAKGNLLVTGNTHTNGNEIVDGTLGVTGATILSNTLAVGNTLGVTGATTLNTLGVTGATTIGGTLGVTGTTTITGTAIIGTPTTTTNLTVNGVVGGITPKGGIILWSGAATAIPAGWALCNGQNGTPNLQDRFVVGAGSAYAVNGTGGATTHVHGTSALYANIGMGYNNTELNFIMYEQRGNLPSAGVITTGDIHGWTGKSGITGQLGATSISGNVDSSSNLPPYYALCYIMKT